MFIVEYYVSEYDDNRHSDITNVYYTFNLPSAKAFIRFQAKQIALKEFESFYKNKVKDSKWMPNKIVLSKKVTKYYIGIPELYLYHIWLLKEIEIIS